MNDNIDREKVLKLMKLSRDKRMFERYQTIYLLLSGMKINEVSNIVGRSVRTIKNYKKLYEILGVEGLLIRKPKGRPSRLSDGQLRKLKKLILTTSPKDVGLSKRINWSYNSIAIWIKKEYGINYTNAGVVNVLKSLGINDKIKFYKYWNTGS